MIVSDLRKQLDFLPPEAEVQSVVDLNGFEIPFAIDVLKQGDGGQARLESHTSWWEVLGYLLLVGQVWVLNQQEEKLKKEAFRSNGKKS